MANVQKPAEGRSPEVKEPTEAEEIAKLLEKRAHCPHHFRYAMLCENTKTHEDLVYTWCQHCGVAAKTVLGEDDEPLPDQPD